MINMYFREAFLSVLYWFLERVSFSGLEVWGWGLVVFFFYFFSVDKKFSLPLAGVPLFFSLNPPHNSTVLIALAEYMELN